MSNEKVKLPGNPDFEPHDYEVREKAFQLYKQGKTQPQISELLKVPLGTIRRWSSKGNWKLRIKEAIPGPGKNCPRLTDTSQPEVDAIAHDMTLGEKQEHYQDRMATQALRLPAIMEKLSDGALIQNADKISKLDQTARKALKLEENKPAVVVNVGLLAAQLPAKAALPAIIDAEVVPALESGETLVVEVPTTPEAVPTQ